MMQHHRLSPTMTTTTTAAAFPRSTQGTTPMTTPASPAGLVRVQGCMPPDASALFARGYLSGVQLYRLLHHRYPPTSVHLLAEVEHVLRDSTRPLAQTCGMLAGWMHTYYEHCPQVVSQVLASRMSKPGQCPTVSPRRPGGAVQQDEQHDASQSPCTALFPAMPRPVDLDDETQGGATHV